MQLSKRSPFYILFPLVLAACQKEKTWDSSSPIHNDGIPLNDFAFKAPAPTDPALPAAAAAFAPIDPTTPEGQAFAQISAELPNYRDVYAKLADPTSNETDAERAKRKNLQREVAPRAEDLFDFSKPTLFEGPTTKNRVQVLVIGQDSVSSDGASAAASRTALQKVLARLGITNSYFYMNALAYPLKSNYAHIEPILRNGEFIWAPVVAGPLAILGHNPDSPVVKNRNKLIDQIIRANPDSLRLIVALGAPAKEALATYIMARGGDCKGVYENMLAVRRYKTKIIPLGPDSEFNVPADKSGRNILITRDEENYRPPGSRNAVPTFLWGTLKNTPIDFNNPAHQAEMQRRLTLKDVEMDHEYWTNARHVESSLRSINAGLAESGFEDVHQLGFAINTCTVAGNGQTLLGATLPADKKTPGFAKELKIASNIHYVALPHIGAPEAEVAFDQRLAKIKDWAKESDWSVPVDNQANQPLAGVAQVEPKNSLMRGQFQKPALLVIADQGSPHDEWVGRALVGEIGQRVQSLLNALAPSSYLILRNQSTAATAPATSLAPAEILKANRHTVKAVITIGSSSGALLDRDDIAPILAADKIAIVRIKDTSDESLTASFATLRDLYGSADLDLEYLPELESIPRTDVKPETPLWITDAAPPAADAAAIKKINEDRRQLRAKSRIPQ